MCNAIGIKHAIWGSTIKDFLLNKLSYAFYQSRRDCLHDILHLVPFIADEIGNAVSPGLRRLQHSIAVYGEGDSSLQNDTWHCSTKLVAFAGKSPN